MGQDADNRKYFEEISAEYDSYYDDPETIMDFEKVTRLEQALSWSDFSNSDIVLNVGVGSGELNRELPSTFSGELVGIDFSRAMIELASNGGDSFVQAAVQRLPLADNSVDTCFCLGVVGYLNHRELDTALAEIHRVLSPNGELILTFGNRSSPFRRFRNFYYYSFLNALKSFFGVGESINHEYDEYDPERILEASAGVGFEVENRAYLTYSSGVFNTPVHKWTYRVLQDRFGDDDRAGSLAMTWILKLQK